MVERYNFLERFAQKAACHIWLAQTAQTRLMKTPSEIRAPKADSLLIDCLGAAKQGLAIDYSELRARIPPRLGQPTSWWVLGL